MWGNNQFGQLGCGNFTNQSKATAIQYPMEIADVKMGNSHTLALTKQNELLAWGSNEFGQLGVGDEVYRTNIPRKIVALDAVVDFSCGMFHSVALDANRGVYSWGYSRKYSVCTDNFPNNVYLPQKIDGISDRVASVHSSNYMNVFLTENSSIYVLGTFQLPDFSIFSVETPKQ